MRSTNTGKNTPRNKSFVRGAIILGAVSAIAGHDTSDFWPVAVAIAYGIGVISMRNREPRVWNVVQAQPPPPYMPPPPPITPASRPTATPPAPPPSTQIAAHLNALVARTAKLVPANVLEIVQSIVRSLETILPMLDRENAAVSGADAFTIRQTALHYLPDTIAAYFKLSPEIRTTQPLADGRTAREHLIEQLTVLDTEMKAIVKNLAANDAAALLANGEFLRERFTAEYFKPV
jgi:hypothetical protein